MRNITQIDDVVTFMSDEPEIARSASRINTMLKGYGYNYLCSYGKCHNDDCSAGMQEMGERRAKIDS